MRAKIAKQRELALALDEIETKLVKSLEKLDSYIQGNGNSKKLKKKSKDCLELLKKSK